MGTGGTKKIELQQEANNIISLINKGFQAFDFEFGTGANVPKMTCVGKLQYQMKFGGSTWIFTLEKKT